MCTIYVSSISQVKSNAGSTALNKTKSISCNYPNTKFSDNQICECLSNQFYGDPFSSKGCLPCKNQCHTNGYCNKNGKCKCKKNFLGDGINNCSLVTPKIISTSGKKCSVDQKEIYFSFKSSPGFVPNKVFCRFGSYYFESERINRTFVKCPCPMLRESTVLSGISFDQENWSPLIEIKFRQQTFSTFYTFPLIIFFTLIAGFACALFWYRNHIVDHRNGEMVELMPLNKWHLHQLQQEIGEESRVIDFIAHIITH